MFSISGSTGSRKRVAVALEKGDRNAVAIEHAVAGERREFRPWRQNAGKVQGIGARNRNETVVRRAPPDRAQGCHRLGKSELLAGEAGDETPTSDLAARLELAIDAQQIAPFRQPGSLALQHAHEHDAVAAEQVQARSARTSLSVALFASAYA